MPVWYLHAASLAAQLRIDGNERNTHLTPVDDQRLGWFREARFGMMIHFGLYSVLERGEWVMFAEHIPSDEYARLAERFAPSQCDITRWVSAARDAGMKYAVFTARHHDGFCLYDSRVSNFSSVRTAAKRDFVAEFVRAARSAGLKVGLYYSWLDWRFPGYFEPEKHSQSRDELIQQAHDQLRELMTNYGKIDYLWYDGHWVPTLWDPDRGNPGLPEFWRAREANAMVRKLQPHIIINNRSGLPEDVDTPEQHVSASQSGRLWETCMTMGDFSGWGYVRNNPNWKTVPQLIQHLATAASGDGNFLLNVGPTPDGLLREEEVARLTAIGQWLRTNGEAIYGTTRCPFPSPFAPGGYEGLVGTTGVATARDNVAYIHVFRWPPLGEICVPDLANEVISAEILGTGHACRAERISDRRLMVRGVPVEPPDRNCTVIKMVLDGHPRFAA